MWALGVLDSKRYNLDVRQSGDHYFLLVDFTWCGPVAGTTGRLAEWPSNKLGYYVS